MFLLLFRVSIFQYLASIFGFALRFHQFYQSNHYLKHHVKIDYSYSICLPNEVTNHQLYPIYFSVYSNFYFKIHNRHFHHINFYFFAFYFALLDFYSNIIKYYSNQEWFHHLIFFHFIFLRNP
jgi:hypothetical protein